MPEDYQLPPPTTFGGQGQRIVQQPLRQSQDSRNPFLNPRSSSLANSIGNSHLVQEATEATQRTSMYNPNHPSQGATGGGPAALPGSLQPGGSAPPGISQESSRNSGLAPAPSGGASAARPTMQQQSYTAPTVPHINTNAQQYTLPTRTSTIGQSASSHSYSRSESTGLTEQKYVPFSAGGAASAAGSATGAGSVAQQRMPDANSSKYPQTPNQKQSHYYTPQTPTAGIHSPLVLDHIRPRANSSLNDETNVYGDLQATNSNYVAPWAVFAFDWCKYPVMGGNSAGKMALGSYLEDPHNFIQIIDTTITPQENGPGYGIEYTRVAEATCSYPVTRILWEPPISQKQSTDLLATSGDHLRLWSLPGATGATSSNTITRTSSVNTRDPAPQKLTPLALLSNSKTPEHTAPLTSLDWNTLSPKLIITSSIDTTCTIWDIPTLTAKTQLIAHDKEVYDVRFCAGSVDVFVSCGADGSVRMFDLRSLEHSTIIYEPSDKQQQDARTEGAPPSPTKANQTLPNSPPLLRLAASPHDSHLLATFAADSNIIRILDVRQPGQALLELRGHSAAINAVEWSPSRRGVLATGGDDSLVLIWDLINANNGANLNNGVNSNNGIGLGLSGSGVPGAGTATSGAASAASGTANAAAAGGAATASGGHVVGAKGPANSWNCDFEVGNLSWAPQSALTSQGGDWLGVSGGRGVWGVKL